MIAIPQSIVEKVQDGNEQRLNHRPVFSPAASEGYPSEQRLLLDDENDTVDPPTPLLLHSARGFLYLTPAEQQGMSSTSTFPAFYNLASQDRFETLERLTRNQATRL